jgi:hypothetical protein
MPVKPKIVERLPPKMQTSMHEELPRFNKDIC